MFTLSHPSESHMLHVTEDVISKSRRDLVDSGYLEESVLRELQSTWERKMRQAGLISATIERYPSPIHSPTYLQTPDPNSLSRNVFDTNDQSNQSLDHLLVSPKQECDGFFIPQQDGANDGVVDEEILNEDDDEEEDAIDYDMNIPHLVMCQFDKVKRSKNKWDCTFKSGVMQINGKNILFSTANGVFNF